jgi:hypothetical protein
MEAENLNLMVVDGFHGTPCSHRISSVLSGLEKEKAPVTGKDVIVPSLTLDEIILQVNKEVSDAFKRINTLLKAADEFSRMVAPCCEILDELKGRAGFIRERIDTLAAKRQGRGTARESSNIRLRNFTGAGVGFINIRDGIRQTIWSGKKGETDPVADFIHRWLNPSDLRAMDEEGLGNLFEEVKMLVRDYEMQLGPYLGRIEEKRDEAYAEKQRLRASANLPETAETITRCISGELVFYPFRCIKYNRIDKEGETHSRWLVLDGINGNIHKEMTGIARMAESPEITNYKIQITNKLQIPMSETSKTSNGKFQSTQPIFENPGDNFINNASSGLCLLFVICFLYFWILRYPHGVEIFFDFFYNFF